MKMHKTSLMAALLTGALIALTPTLRAEEKADKPGRPERPQGGPGGGQRREEMKDRLAKMAEELKLTAEQKTKVEAAMKEQAEAMKGLKDATQEERREKMQENRKAMDAKIKGILTAEQYAKWEKVREQNRPGGPGAGGPNGKRRGGPGSPDGEKPEKN